jgi:2-polyprenyl-3-methyl-5-hydroxy-6-metoxy-1,4-benzoquinol methylase
LRSADHEELAFDLMECETCGLVKISHQVRVGTLSDYERAFLRMIEQTYALRPNDRGLRLFEKRTALFHELRPGRLLDIGCERGYFLAAMRRRGWRVRGVEPHRPFARFARDHFDVEVFEGKLEEYEGSEQFDLITMWHVLEHIEDPLRALSQCSSLLTPGGRLFFEVPNIDSLGRHLTGPYWLPFRDPTHRWFFRPRALRELAERCGLVVQCIRPAGSPGAWYGLKRSIGSRLRGQDYWSAKIFGARRPVSRWRSAAAVMAGLQPLSMIIASTAESLGRGEVLHGWCVKSAVRPTARRRPTRGAPASA